MTDLFDGRNCTVCGFYKPFHRFSLKKSGKNGRANRCKDCANQFNRSYFSNPANRDKKNLHRKTNLKSKASALLNGKCEKTGIEFVFTIGIRHPFSPSIDRIDCSGPYTDDNVQVVCWAYNVGKAEMSDEEYANYLLRASSFINASSAT